MKPSRISTLVFITAFFIIISINARSNAARILALFPTPSISHQVVFRPLTQELAKRGHEVVVLTTDPVFPKGQAPANLTEIDVHDLSYKIWREQFLATDKGNANHLYNQLKVAFDAFTILFEKQVQTNEFQEILKNKKDYFNLLLIEACFRPALALSHVFSAPVIQISSSGRMFGSYETIGAPVHPFLFPLGIRQRIYNLSLWEKVTELYTHHSLTRLYESHEQEENKMIRQNFGSDVPALSDLSANVHMLFLNVHPIFEGNQPVPPTVIHLWGLHQKPEKELTGHPNIKLFITQGGLQSTDEAIFAGVPLLGIPMLGDQWYNTEKYVYHKIGVQLNFKTLTDEDFRNAIDSVIGDTSYRQNIIKLRSLFMDQPQPPLARAVWWTEYVLRHDGAGHLRSPAANITWAEYLELELVFILLMLSSAGSLTFVAVFYYFYRYITRLFFGNVKTKVK